MSTERRPTSFAAAHRSRGFSLIELIVTVAIAMFLLAGLVTIFNNTRVTYKNQQALAQLQDQQRFAMQLITAVVESGGYYDNPTGFTEASALPAQGVFATFAQAFYGTGNALAPPNSDKMYVQFRTALNDGIINCLGGQNTTYAPDHVYTNEFSVANGQLMCSVDGGAAVPLVNGIANMQIYYGVKRQGPFTDYNVDTYVTAQNVQGPAEWQQVSAVRVILTFTNPLAGQTGQPPTLVFERVIEVMSRGGDYT